MAHMRMNRITHVNESFYTYEWVMSHTCMSHVTHVNESCHTHEGVMSHIWMSHVIRMNESCHAYERVMSHKWMIKYLWINRVSEVAHINIQVEAFWILRPYTLQHAATRCNTLQHTATHCNTSPPPRIGAKSCILWEYVHVCVCEWVTLWEREKCIGPIHFSEEVNISLWEREKHVLQCVVVCCSVLSSLTMKYVGPIHFSEEFFTLCLNREIYWIFILMPPAIPIPPPKKIAKWYRNWMSVCASNVVKDTQIR